MLEALPVQLRGSLRDGPPFLHVLTHKDLHLHPVLAKGDATSAMPGTGQWLAPDAWDGLGLPAPVRKLLSA